MDLQLTAQRGPYAGVLYNDVDPDGTTPTAQIVTPPASGNLSLNANGTFTFAVTGVTIAGKTYNAALNYENRNASSTYTTQDIATSYSIATSSAIVVALGIRKLVDKQAK